MSNGCSTDTVQQHRAIYELPSLYDRLIQPGPCEPFYRREAAAAGGPLLELACGTGRLTVPIAADGHDVIGLDASASMLATARAKAVSAGLRIMFIEGDMRQFDLGRRFALIILSCNSLGHMTTPDALLDCLRSISRHLTHRGRFVFDIVNPDVGLLARSADEVVSLDLGAPFCVRESATYDRVSQIRTVRWRVTAPSGRVRVLAPLALRQIFPQEVPLLLEAGGLRLVRRYGNFERGPFCGDCPNQICVAEPAT